MDLTVINLDGQLFKEIEDEVSKECPEEVKFIDSLEKVGEYDGPCNKIQSVLGASYRKSFEMGFKIGQQLAGREKPIGVRWLED